MVHGEESPWLYERSDWDELALAEWGIREHEAEPEALADLLYSYTRRKRWEAELIAVSIVNKLSMALEGGTSEAPATAMQPRNLPMGAGKPAPGREWVDFDTLVKRYNIQER
ncbi:MAG: hypothetical protein D6800_13390 [Candidatus Zixiibacteriota bacterium]|nr:MAG: hypothetical protein D6800_13390 [candidate division Zixibacteria bacterium]